MELKGSCILCEVTFIPLRFSLRASLSCSLPFPLLMNVSLKYLRIAGASRALPKTLSGGSQWPLNPSSFGSALRFFSISLKSLPQNL